MVWPQNPTLPRLRRPALPETAPRRAWPGRFTYGHERERFAPACPWPPRSARRGVGAGQIEQKEYYQPQFRPKLYK